MVAKELSRLFKVSGRKKQKNKRLLPGLAKNRALLKTKLPKGKEAIDDIVKVAIILSGGTNEKYKIINTIG